MELKVTPYRHQKEAADFALRHYAAGSRGVAFFMEVGTGKTLPAVMTACRLHEEGKVRRLLVVCPLAVFRAWAEAFELTDTPKTVTEYRPGREGQIFCPHPGLDVILINYESAWRRAGQISAWAPEMVICDESQKIKSPQSAQSKYLHKLGDRTRYKMILTGTPVGNSPLDFWSQYRFLDPAVFGGSYYAFRAAYAVVRTETQWSTGRKYPVIVGYRNEDRLIEKAHRLAVRVRKEDCLDLPEQTDEYRCVTLEPEARKIYDGLRKDAVAELFEGHVTASNILTRLMRLSQVCGGYIGADEEECPARQIRQISRAKLEALCDIAEEVLAQGRKLVVFARFTPEIDGILAMLSERFPASGAVRMTGETPAAERGEIIRRFQTDPDCRVFVGNAQCAGAGITLTAADVMVFYSLSYSYLDYEQARARIHRIGQRNRCTYLHLLVSDSVDALVLEAVQNKHDLARLFVDRERSGPSETVRSRSEKKDQKGETA